MTRTISNSRSTTLDLLLNTLKRFLGSLEARNEYWLRRRDEEIEQQRFYARNKKRDREARTDWDIANERVTLGDGLLVVEILIRDLISSLEGNPFPGRYLSVLNAAEELFPDIKVMLQPKVFISGRKLWLQIFEIGGIEYWQQFRFPVKVEEIDVAEVEKLLWDSLREDGTIAASEVPALLHMDPRSKSYCYLKDKLKERNWVWSSRRESGTVTKIVIAPR